MAIELSPRPSVLDVRWPDAIDAAQVTLPAEQQAQRDRRRRLRRACNTLQLHRLCAHRRCRKARRCRGDPLACYRTCEHWLPDPIEQWISKLIAAPTIEQYVNELAASQRLAWECWIAGLRAADVRARLTRLTRIAGRGKR
jgi:hypothetical protein